MRHVRALLEHKLDECLAGDALALDTVDPRNVEEVIFVVIRQIPFHLLRVHSAVRLGDVNHGISNLRKNVYRHPLKRQYRNERQREQCYNDR